MRRAALTTAAIGLLIAAAPLRGQTPPPPPPPPTAPAAPPSSTPVEEPIPVRVDVVLSRWSGEKRISSLPIGLVVAVASSSQNSASLRLDSRIPVLQGMTSSYQSVGTNVDVVVSKLASGRFRLELILNDSSVADGPGREAASAAQPMPVIRSNSLRTSLVLRDGQPGEIVIATDKVSGETIKAEVKITTMK